MASFDSTNQTNQEIESKCKAAIEKMRSLQKSLGIKHTTNPSLEKITVSFSRRFGIISKVSFFFKISGVFVHMGIGKNGTQNRTPKNWLSPVLDELADDLQNIAADGLINATYENLNL